MTKAYKDREFINSAAARPLRLLSEYIEPRDRFERFGVNRALIFWGSARIRPNAADSVDERADYYAEARELAARMARWTMDKHPRGERFVICTGGGPGIMEAANRGAADVDIELSMGLGIDLPNEQGLNDYVSDALNLDFHYFFMRKFWFMNVARALIVFPGGFGTMDELFEMLTLIQTRRQESMPVILFGGHFWRRLINFDVFLELGLIAPEDVDLCRIVDTVDEAETLLTDRLGAT